MLKFLKRLKKMKVKVLVAVNGDTHEPIDYHSVVDVDLKTEVMAACNSLACPFTDEFIDKIVAALKKGEPYCTGQYGFEVLTLEV